jgi:hypothetical protein
MAIPHNLLKTKKKHRPAIYGIVLAEVTGKQGETS